MSETAHVLPPKPQIYTSGNPTVTRIVPELAAEIGLNESIILLQIAFWIKTSNNLRDGRYWTYQSSRDMKRKAFPYWSHSTIDRAVKKLIAQGYVIEGAFNTRKYDTTRWLALNPEGLATLKSVVVRYETPLQNETGTAQDETGMSQNETRLTQSETPIPEIPSERIPEIPSESSSRLCAADDDSRSGRPIPEEAAEVFSEQPELARHLMKQHGEKMVVAWCQYVGTRDNIPNPVGYVRSMVIQGNTPPVPNIKTQDTNKQPVLEYNISDRERDKVAMAAPIPPVVPGLRELPSDLRVCWQMIFANFAHTDLANTTFMRQAKMFPKSVNIDAWAQPLGIVGGDPDTLIVMVEKHHLRTTLDQPGIQEMLRCDLARWGHCVQLRFVAPSMPHRPIHKCKN